MENDLLFSVYGYFSEAELLNMAESVCMDPQAKWVWPAYDFAQVPDGYVKMAEGDTWDSRDIFYAKEEDGLRLSCYYTLFSKAEPALSYSET